MAVVWWPLCRYQNWATEQHHLVKFQNKTNTEDWYSYSSQHKLPDYIPFWREVWLVAWKCCGIQSRMREQAAGGWSSTLEKSSSPLQPSKQIKPASWRGRDPAWTVKKTVIGTLGLSFPFLCCQRHYSCQDVSQVWNQFCPWLTDQHYRWLHKELSICHDAALKIQRNFLRYSLSPTPVSQYSLQITTTWSMQFRASQSILIENSEQRWQFQSLLDMRRLFIGPNCYMLNNQKKSTWSAENSRMWKHTLTLCFCFLRCIRFLAFLPLITSYRYRFITLALQGNFWMDWKLVFAVLIKIFVSPDWVSSSSPVCIHIVSILSSFRLEFPSHRLRAEHRARPEVAAEVAKHPPMMTLLA